MLLIEGIVVAAGAAGAGHVRSVGPAMGQEKRAGP
jgi:hypothetical protein